MYLTNDQGQICHVSLDNRLLLLSSCNSNSNNSNNNNTLIPLVVHEPSTKYATDICGRSSVICNFINNTNCTTNSNINVNSNNNYVSTKNHYPISWIVTSKECSNNDQIVLVWYPQIETKEKNPLIEELNSCITPSYLCHHIYGWYVSDNVDESVVWTVVTHDNNKKSNYKLLNTDATTVTLLIPNLF
jgi:hypothetical protein